MTSHRFITENSTHLAGGDAAQFYPANLKQDTKSEYHVIQHIEPVPDLDLSGRNLSGADQFQFGSQTSTQVGVSPFRRSFSKRNTPDKNVNKEKLQFSTEANFQRKPQSHNTQIQPHYSEAEKQTKKSTRYKFDEHYLACVQNFTSYCEDRTDLFFDGSIFFDDAFFPRSMQLSEYVPVTVIAPYIEIIDLQVPSGSEYCKFAPCGSTIYDYFEDYQACTNRESILRSQVTFILDSLQCPQLNYLGIDSTRVDETNIERYPVDRLADWNENISSFISRHAKTLKCIHIKMVRYKRLGTMSAISTPIESFPKLRELSVTLWDNQIVTSKDTDSGLNDKNVWMPNWLPDSADQYWISLMRSQCHGVLTKLCWISAADLSWNEVFQPIIEFNKNTLESLHIMEIESIQTPKKIINNNNDHCSMHGDNASPSFSISNVVRSCAAFSKLSKLKSLYLRKTNCYLTNLKMLPKAIQELSVEDIIIKTSEISTLASFPNLKILRLSNCLLPKTCSDDSKEKFGVNRSTLKDLLHSRSLQELCIWRHRLEFDMNALSPQRAFNLTSVLEKINSYLATICKSPNKISPSQFYEWDSQQLNQDKRLLNGLKKLGFVDEECVVIHE